MSEDVIPDDVIPDDMTELYDARVPRIDLVGKGANGMPPLLAKQDAEASAGMFEAGFVRDLIAKSVRPRPTDTQEVVTVSGSPAALADVMARIHGAPVRKAGPAPDPADGYEALAKAKYDTAERKRMASSGAARSDGSYPIADREDVHNAVMAVGRGDKSEHNAIRRHIISRADSLGAKSLIPDSWNADGSLRKSDADSREVSKDMDNEEMTDAALDPTVVFAEPDGEAPGNPNDPGSPAWEAQDAANARKWTAIAARLRAAIEVMCDREILEAVSADGQDAYAAEDLADARDAVDFAISVLAPFAVGEQSEADCGADQYAMVTKAMGGLRTADLDTLETLGALRKAGRALSSTNESALRTAISALQSILASLPKAAPDAQGPATSAGMEKGAEMASESTEAALTERHPLGTAKEPASAEAPAAVPGPGAVAKEQETGAASVAKTEQPAADTTAEAEPVAKAAGEQPTAPSEPDPAAVAKAAEPAQATLAESAEPVAKTAECIAGNSTSAAEAREHGAGEQALAKAKTPQVAIYDAQGNLVGTVDPAEITMLAPAKAADADPAPAPAEPAPEAPAAADPAATPAPDQAVAPADLTPAPDADAGTPADGVAKAATETTGTEQAPAETEYVLKSSLANLIKAALADHSATQEQALAKQAEGFTAQLAKVTEALNDRDAALDERLKKSASVLEERLTTLENAPAVMAIASNGARPPAHLLRGQNHGSAEVDAPTAAMLKAAFRNADDAVEQKATAEAMTSLAMAKFQAMKAEQQQAARR